MKLDILAIGVHPDDIELSCSGTLLKHIEKGYKIGLCDLTQGELGTRGSGGLRLKEAETARQMMGALCRDNLGMKDGFFLNTQENILKIVTVIRKYRPEIIFANALEDRHPDHGRAAKLVADACFYSGLQKIEDGYEKWRPKTLYHYIQDRNLAEDFVVDITDQMKKKMELIACFKSQFFNSKKKKSSEPKTPISSKSFLDFIYAKNKSYGRSIQVDYAEAFNKSRTIGVDDVFDLR